MSPLFNRVLGWVSVYTGPPRVVISSRGAAEISSRSSAMAYRRRWVTQRWLAGIASFALVASTGVLASHAVRAEADPNYQGYENGTADAGQVGYTFDWYNCVSNNDCAPFSAYTTAQVTVDWTVWKDFQASDCHYVNQGSTPCYFVNWDRELFWLDIQTDSSNVDAGISDIHDEWFNHSYTTQQNSTTPDYQANACCPANSSDWWTSGYAYPDDGYWDGGIVSEVTASPADGGCCVEGFNWTAADYNAGNRQPGTSG